jgi:hypothetical protein
MESAAYLLALILTILPHLEEAVPEGKERMLREKITIGRGENEEIYSATGLAVDDQGNVYVSDQLEYCVKKYNPTGKLVGRTGKRGVGPGEFRAPVTLAVWRDTILVLQINNTCIQAFSRDLVYLGSRKIEEGMPVDIAISPQGELLVALLSDEGERERVQVFPSLLGGSPIEIVTASGIGGHVLFGACKVAAAGDGSVICLSLFLNRIAWYSRSGKLLAVVRIPGIADPGVDMNARQPPTATSFKGIQVDPAGNVLVLAGSLARNPGVDVFVLGPRGSYRGVMKLRRPSRLLAVDRRGYLYATADEGTMVKKYMPPADFPAGESTR